MSQKYILPHMPNAIFPHYKRMPKVIADIAKHNGNVLFLFH